MIFSSISALFRVKLRKFLKKKNLKLNLCPISLQFDKINLEEKNMVSKNSIFCKRNKCSLLLLAPKK